MALNIGGAARYGQRRNRGGSNVLARAPQVVPRGGGQEPQPDYLGMMREAKRQQGGQPLSSMDRHKMMMDLEANRRSEWGFQQAKAGAARGAEERRIKLLTERVRLGLEDPADHRRVRQEDFQSKFDAGAVTRTHQEARPVQPTPGGPGKSWNLMHHATQPTPEPTPEPPRVRQQDFQMMEDFKTAPTQRMTPPGPPSNQPPQPLGWSATRRGRRWEEDTPPPPVDDWTDMGRDRAVPHNYPPTRRGRRWEEEPPPPPVDDWTGSAGSPTSKVANIWPGPITTDDAAQPSGRPPVDDWTGSAGSPTSKVANIWPGPITTDDAAQPSGRPPEPDEQPLPGGPTLEEVVAAGRLRRGEPARASGQRPEVPQVRPTRPRRRPRSVTRPSQPDPNAYPMYGEPPPPPEVYPEVSRNQTTPSSGTIPARTIETRGDFADTDDFRNSPQYAELMEQKGRPTSEYAYAAAQARRQIEQQLYDRQIKGTELATKMGPAIAAQRESMSYGKGRKFELPGVGMDLNAQTAAEPWRLLGRQDNSPAHKYFASLTGKSGGRRGGLKHRWPPAIRKVVQFMIPGSGGEDKLWALYNSKDATGWNSAYAAGKDDFEAFNAADATLKTKAGIAGTAATKQMIATWVNKATELVAKGKEGKLDREGRQELAIIVAQLEFEKTERERGGEPKTVVTVKDVVTAFGDKIPDIKSTTTTYEDGQKPPTGGRAAEKPPSNKLPATASDKEVAQALKGNLLADRAFRKNPEIDIRKLARKYGLME